MARCFVRVLLALTATLVCVLPFGASPAASDVGLQNVNLACSDDTSLNVAADVSSLVTLTDVVKAIDLYPAGDPALSCSLSQTTSTSSSSGNRNGPKDFAVGGGRYLVGTFGPPENFSISAHAADDAPPTPPQPGVGGTVTLTTPSPNGHLVTRVDCFVAPAPSNPLPGTAQATAVVTKSTGVYAAFFPVGTEMRWDIFDSGMPGPAPNGDAFTGTFVGAPCQFTSYDPAAFGPVDKGSIKVRDA